MRFAVACDHAGFALKQPVVDALGAMGFGTIDLGTDNATDPIDYPDSAEAVGGAITSGVAERGILICGSGVGAGVAANKLPGIRAAVCHDTFSARQGVEDDDMNVLCLGARVIGPQLALECVRAFAAAEFSHAERHVRRLAKVHALEARSRRREAPHG